MINVYELSVGFSGENLFEKISFRLGEGDRIGLVGKNGAGKSTLLKVLAGDIEPVEGNLAYEKEIKIGFLRQDIDFEQGRTVLEEAHSAFKEIKKIEHQIEAVNTALAEETDYESEAYHQLMVDINELQQQYEILGGYNYHGEAERVLQGLGFTKTDLDKNTETFSGGWRMRIELAKLLLQKNDILLLDEPTNHLDIESIIWFENFLKKFTGCALIVSHDKMFLDNVTNRTIEISVGKIYDYNKSYSDFLKLREERRTQQLAAKKNQDKEIEQTEKLIEKFRYKATKATMAQSLIKKLDKMERIQVDEEDQATMHLNFPVSINPGKVVIKIKNVSKSFGEKQVLKNVNLLISRQTKTAFVGQNGQGKSTLAKIIVGELSHQGDLELGHNVQLGYFAQNQADYLDGSKTILEIMQDAANEKNRKKVRDILGAFLFRGEDVEKQVKVLSGGERNRLALAKLLLQPSNVLIMDEPTNHLDIQSKIVLKEALNKYDGTLLIVSHDRDFLEGLTSVVYEFKDHQLNEYLGDINYYLERRELNNMREVEQKTSSVKTKKPKNKPTKQSYETQKKLKSLKNKISKIELNISQLEQKIKEKDLALEVDYDKTVADPDFFKLYQNDKDKLEKYMQKWERLQHEYESKMEE